MLWKSLPIILILIVIATSLFTIALAEAKGPEVITEDNWRVYFKPQGPWVEKLVIKLLPNPKDEALAVERGEVDITSWHIPIDLARKLKEENFTVVATPSYFYYALYFNLRKWPLNDIYFRRAIAHLVDKDRIVRDILKGAGVPIDTFVPPIFGEWVNRKVKRYEYSPELAIKCLEEGGYRYSKERGTWIGPNGREVPRLYILAPSNDPIKVEVAKLIAREARRIGLPIYVKEVDFNTLLQLIDPSVARFDMFILGRHPGYTLDYLYQSFHSSQDRAHGWNWAGVKDPELDRWLEKILLARSRDEVMMAVHKVQEILAEKLPGIPLYVRILYSVARKGWRYLVAEPGFGVTGSIPLGGWTYLMARSEKFKVLRLSLPTSRISSLNPLVTISGYDWYVLGRIYDPLIAINPFTLELMPWIAVKWSTEKWSRGIIVTIHIAKNITWHDGTPLTAHDVAYTYKLLKLSSIWAPKVKYVVKTEVVDNYTVRIYLNTSSYWALYWIGYVPVLPKHIWEKVEDPLTYPNDRPVGSGPYIFKSYEPEKKIVVLLANKKYFKYPKVLKIRTAEEVGVGMRNVLHYIVIASIVVVAVGIALWRLRRHHEH
ncbi:MAG: hypothetical protein DRJ40_10040 [Thermoprotei archaeon]|nr:MAG: hypothetical protein DRJ40_10040 [Thermoprotei archaeon]